jgi:hypothetical protein
MIPRHPGKFQVEVPSRIVRGRRAARSRSAPSGGCGAMGASAGGPSSKSASSGSIFVTVNLCRCFCICEHAPDCCALHPLTYGKSTWRAFDTTA